jgi:hypothetical protein
MQTFNGTQISSAIARNTPLQELMARGIAPLRDGGKYADLLAETPYFFEVAAGAKHHHWWVGGLNEHVLEMVAWMIDQVDRYPDAYSDVNLTDVIVTAFLHDFDKIWSYERLSLEDATNPKYAPGQIFKSTSCHTSMLDGLNLTLLHIARRGIVPTNKQWSAVLFAHGGYADANFTFGGASRTGSTVMHANNLAVLLNMADMYSSQLLGKSIA